MFPSLLIYSGHHFHPCTIISVSQSHTFCACDIKLTIYESLDSETSESLPVIGYVKNFVAEVFYCHQRVYIYMCN